MKKPLSEMKGAKMVKPLLMALAVLFAAAAVFDGAAPAAEKPEEAEVAVMPFIKGRDPNDLSQTLSCPFERFCYEDASLQADADQILTRMVQDRLSQKLAQRVVPLKTVERTFRAVRFDAAESTPLDAAHALGRALEVDYVLVGNVWRYRERVGSDYGVENPASVAFALYLVDVEDGKPVWLNAFNETQKSLSENVLRAREFFKRGAKWLKARELAGYGLTEMMKTFPVE